MHSNSVCKFCMPRRTFSLILVVLFTSILAGYSAIVSAHLFTTTSASVSAYVGLFLVWAASLSVVFDGMFPFNHLIVLYN